MAGMTAAFHNLLRAEAIAKATHVGLVDETGTELTGGSPAYSRLEEAWVTTGGDGIMNLAANRVFNVPSGVTVGGWRAYSLVSGGVNYGGKDLVNEEFTAQGTYTLLANSTSITIANPTP
jgi:hypothetical protein